jgi:O-acetyl-ADP-ribose deacetylase (regulator of RNase III)
MGKFNLLTECYRGALRTARENNIKTIAFPCLATGGCGFPSRVAARTALQEVREFLDVYKTNPFERIIFCVFNGTDEKSYQEFLPIFFPPTHGDIELQPALKSKRDPALLAVQVQDAFTRLEDITQDLVLFSSHIPEFPQSIFTELAGIIEALRALGRKFSTPDDITGDSLDQSVDDIDLICSVLQGFTTGITEIAEQTKYTKPLDGPMHKKIWDDYSLHKRNVQGLEVHILLRLCREFVQGLDDIVVYSGLGPPNMNAMRIRLGTIRLKQTGESHQVVEDKFAEAMYSREFSRDTGFPNRTDTIRVYQIPTLSRLYQLNELGSRQTDAIPNARFNQIICLLREDITTLEVDVIVNSTDMGFSGMGTLDRTVFKKGGLSMHEECTNFGICKEGDVKVTGGHMLPAKKVIHAIPPEIFLSNTKEILRNLYSDIFSTAMELKATSIAIPTIGTGMLNYPRRNCAALALEAAKQFLETVGDTCTIEKIIFCVFGSSDEFIYKSLLPVVFPPLDLNVNKALPSDWRQSSRTQADKATSPSGSPPPKRTIFGTIGEAFRNVRFGRQEVTPAVGPTSRPITTSEEHALINFEIHAQECTTCSYITKLYTENKDLCADGYGQAQGLLQYMNMEDDGFIYSRIVENDQRIQLEVSPDDYPKSWDLLVTVEKSFRDEHRTRPFVSPSQPYAAKDPLSSTRQTSVGELKSQQGQFGGSKAKEPEKAVASVYTWSNYSNNWERLQPYECSIHIYPGRLDIFETEFQTDRQVPLLSLELTDPVPIQKQMSVEVALKAPNLQEPRNNPWKNVMIRSRSPGESAMLFTRLKQARTNEQITPPTRDPATAAAHVFTKDTNDEDWRALFPFVCKVHVYLGRMELYENETAETQSSPFAAFELTPLVEHRKDAIDVIFTAQALANSRVKPKGKILLRSNNLEACNDLYE